MNLFLFNKSSFSFILRIETYIWPNWNATN